MSQNGYEQEFLDVVSRKKYRPTFEFVQEYENEVEFIVRYYNLSEYIRFSKNVSANDFEIIKEQALDMLRQRHTEMTMLKNVMKDTIKARAASRKIQKQHVMQRTRHAITTLCVNEIQTNIEQHNNIANNLIAYMFGYNAQPAITAPVLDTPSYEDVEE